MLTNLLLLNKSLKNPKFISTRKGYLSSMRISGSMKTPQYPGKTQA